MGKTYGVVKIANGASVVSEVWNEVEEAGGAADTEVTGAEVVEVAMLRLAQKRRTITSTCDVRTQKGRPGPP